MRTSATIWFLPDEVPTIDFEGGGTDGMVTVYLGKDLEIYMHRDELQHLAERIDQFLKEKEHVTSTR